MKPKEKALELFDKMYAQMPYLGYNSDQTYIIAKKWALITVDEILAIFYDDIQSMWVDELNYWQEVKQQIKAL